MIFGRAPLLAALVFGLCAAPAATAVVSDAPFLWKVQGPKAVHYLMGSVHLLPESAYPLPSAIELAYARTEGLVLETDPAALETPETQAQMIDSGVSGRGLEKEIAPDLYARVRQHALQAELPATVCDRFKAWLCALSLALFDFQRAGMDPRLGLDQHFYGRAVADGRAIAWLESPQAQLALFSSMNAAESQQFLVSSLDDLDEPGWQPAQVVKMWRDNDTTTLGGLVDDTRREFPQTHARLVGNRNRAWVEGLLRKFGGPTPQLVIVGAAHLVGKGSVVELLGARGMRAQPVSELAEP